MGLDRESKQFGASKPQYSDYGPFKFALILAFAMFTLSNLVYITNRGAFFISGSSPTSVYLSLVLLLIGATFLSFSASSFFRTARKEIPSLDSSTGRVAWKIKRIIADSLFDNKKKLLIAFSLYAVFFCFLDGIIIYQPSIDFFQAYGVNGIQATVSTCCGFPGYIPSVSIYFPAQHAGILIIPVNILLMVLISSLVALNLALLFKATGLSLKTKGRGNGGSLGFVGAFAGLFAGCPTCAAAFFLSIIAGSGATAFSLYISHYEALIVAFTLPILIGSIYWQSKSIRILLEGCTV